MDDLLDKDGQVRPERVDDLLIEVVSSKRLFTFENELYATRSPIADEQDKARVFYRRALHKAAQMGLPGRQELRTRMIDLGVLDADDIAERAAFEKTLENLTRAREHTTDPRQKVALDAELMDYRTRLMVIEYNEEEVLKHSAEGRAEDSRIDFLTSCCTVGGEFLDELIWKEWSEYQNSINYGLLVESRESFVRTLAGLSIKIIRALARTPAWRARWKTSQHAGVSPFGGTAADWDRNKVNLIYWSDFYDSVYQHPEHPADDVIANDELLQEWLNTQLAKKTGAAPETPAGVRPLTYRVGGQNGPRKQMTFLGQDKMEVRPPYRIRTTPRAG